MRILILLAVLLNLSSQARAGVFNPETFTLDNGMQVVLIKNDRVPVVNHMVWYKVGSADETPGKSGIAHYFEHLMFKGTKTRAPGEFSKLVAKNGGQENAFTSYDYTAYYQTVAKDRLALVMEMEADRMTNLTLDAEVIEPERKVILEERAQRVENDPGSQLSEQTNTVIYMNHPYRIPIIGWEHEIKTLSLEDLRHFYKKWYAPNNAILVVEGDITLDELRPLAEKYYGVIPRGPEITRVRPSEPKAHANRRVEKRDARVRQPYMRLVYHAPSYREFGNDEMSPYALEVLDYILGGGATSRLYRSLVIDQKIAISAGSGYSPTSHDLSTFSFWVSPAQGVEIEEVETALKKELDLMIEKGVTLDEVMRAQKALVNDAVFARDNLGTASRVLGGALASGISIDVIEDWPTSIQKVTVQDVNRAMRELFKGKTVTSVLLGEEKKS